MKLNLGCGSKIVENWINVDYSLGARLIKIPSFKFINKHFKLFNIDWDKRIFLHDLTKIFPWQDETIDVIYSSHTLEHLSKVEGLQFLKECYRVLKKRGVIRIIVPDLQSIVNNYNNKVFPANEFIERLDTLYYKKNSRLKTLLMPLVQFPHKCMYDNFSLLSIMNDIGFDAKSKGAFDSDIEDIRKIEIEMRTTSAVIVEGKK
jgi:predicted SAM-dependent methyltransferase